MAETSPTIFISYAREDIDAAKRIYSELKSLGANVWLDQESILPGQNWKVAINQEIRNCRYFLAILSQNSVTKKGFVQRELSEALDILKEFPTSDIFIIPIRLNDCVPSHERLKDIQWADMFPSWESGLSKICSAIGIEAKTDDSNEEDLDTTFDKSRNPFGQSTFKGSKTIKESENEIRDFHKNRIDKIIKDKTPIELKHKPKIVLHIIPVFGFDQTSIDLKSQNYILNLQPLGADRWNHKYNYDGLLTFSGQRNALCDSYLQLFRNGVIETVDSNMLDDDLWGKKIPSVLYEETLINALRTYMKFECNLGFEPPLLALISLLGIRGYTMAVDPRVSFGKKVYIDRDSLILPEILIKDYSLDAAQLLRPAFDVVWQAAGFSGSRNYDENNMWVGH